MTWEIFGHDWAVKLLKIHAAGEKLRHAYLFVGPVGIGRRTLALHFAQALNCQRAPAPGEFCGECRDCRGIQKMQHPDLSLVKPEEGHQDILIDQVRALQHTLALAPYAAAYRVALLPDFQHVTIQAQNALLKTLEEPPEKVILLLTVNAAESLLPTIVSRCEVIRLRPASLRDTQDFLQSNRGLDEDQARLIAHLSGGRIGAALHMVEDPHLLDGRRETIDTLLNLLPARRYERFSYADDLSRPYGQARQQAGSALSIWLSFWRDVFICSSGSTLPLVNLDLQPEVDHIASMVELQEARSLVIAHENAIEQLERNANIRLLLETLMLQWPFVP